VKIQQESSGVARGMLITNFAGARLWVIKCLFQGSSGPLFSPWAGVAYFYIWYCLFSSGSEFDIKLHSDRTGSIGDSEYLENVMSYVGTNTYALKVEGNCRVIYVDTDENGITAGGVLSNPKCESSIAEKDVNFWQLGTSGRTDRIKGETTNECLVIRDCTFLDMSSTTESGGAVNFRGPTNATVIDSQFTSCRSVPGDSSSSKGGALYLEVSRVSLIGVCGTKCVAYFGTFLCSFMASAHVEVSGVMMHEDNANDLYTGKGSGTIYLYDGYFGFTSSNFSYCEQGEGSAILEQETAVSEGMILTVHYITCMNCSGGSGIGLRYPFEVELDDSLFVGNSNSLAWFSLFTAGTLDVDSCQFLAHNGELLHSATASSKFRLFSCLLGGLVPSSVENGVVEILWNEGDLPLKSSFAMSALRSCYVIVIMPTWKFSPTEGLSESRKFTSTNVLKETSKISCSSLFAQSNNVSQTNVFDSTDFFSFSGSFSCTNDLTNTRSLSGTLSFDTTGTWSCSMLWESWSFSESKAMSLTGEVSNSDFESKSLSLSSSGHFSLTNSFSQWNISPTPSASFSVVTSRSTCSSSSSTSLRFSSPGSASKTSSSSATLELSSHSLIFSHLVSSLESVAVGSHSIGTSLVKEVDSSEDGQSLFSSSAIGSTKSLFSVSKQTVFPKSASFSALATKASDASGSDSIAKSDGGERESNGEEPELTLLVVSIILLVLLSVLFGGLMYMENEKKRIEALLKGPKKTEAK
jgi:hypothetical protein